MVVQLRRNVREKEVTGPSIDFSSVFFMCVGNAARAGGTKRTEALRSLLTFKIPGSRTKETGGGSVCRWGRRKSLTQRC